jgi:hypothetical protein
MRILVSACPAVGHVVPMLDLAVDLQVAGHEVRFATNEESHRLVTGAGLRPVSAGMSTTQMREERRRRWPETDGQPVTVWATRMWAQVMAPSTLADLIVRMQEWSPDLVLHDEGEYAAPVAAARAGIPWVTHGWGSPLRPAVELVELEDVASALWKSCGRAGRRPPGSTRTRWSILARRSLPADPAGRCAGRVGCVADAPTPAGRPRTGAASQCLHRLRNRPDLCQCPLRVDHRGAL